MLLNVFFLRYTISWILLSLRNRNSQVYFIAKRHQWIILWPLVVVPFMRRIGLCPFRIPHLLVFFYFLKIILKEREQERRFKILMIDFYVCVWSAARFRSKIKFFKRNQNIKSTIKAFGKVLECTALHKVKRLWVDSWITQATARLRTVPPLILKLLAGPLLLCRFSVMAQPVPLLLPLPLSSLHVWLFLI